MSHAAEIGLTVHCKLNNSGTGCYLSRVPRPIGTWAIKIADTCMQTCLFEPSSYPNCLDDPMVVAFYVWLVE